MGVEEGGGPVVVSEGAGGEEEVSGVALAGGEGEQ